MVLVEFLVEHQADLNAENINGETPIFTGNQKK